MKNRSLLAGLLLALALPWSVLAEPPPARPPEPVRLHFAWPLGLTAKVTRTAGIDSPYGGKSLGVGDRSYRITVREAGGGLRLDSTELEAAPESLLSTMMDPLPTVLFDHDGTYRGHLFPENSAAQQMMDGMQQIMPLPPEKRREVQAQLEAAYEEVARGFWDKLVTPWRELKLVSGEPLKRTTRIRLGAMFERVEVDAEQTVTLQAGVQCSKAARARSCVKLIADTAKAWEAEGPQQSFRMKRTRASIHFELVVDPRRLLSRICG